MQWYKLGLTRQEECASWQACSMAATARRRVFEPSATRRKRPGTADALAAPKPNSMALTEAEKAIVVETSVHEAIAQIGRARSGEVTAQAKKGRHLILHAGLPKTGTSALQHALWSNRNALALHGVLYPDDVVLYRHQSFLGALIKGVPFEPPWRTASEYARHSVVVSSEGLSNHFDDIPDAGHAVLRELGAEFDHRTVYLVTRDPHAWALSYYKQCLINPRMGAMPVYATSARYSEFVRLPRVRRLADVETLLADMRRATRFDVVRLDYDASGIAKLYQRLAGCDPPNDLDARVNASMSDAAAEIARRINERFGDAPWHSDVIALLRRAVTLGSKSGAGVHGLPPIGPESLAALRSDEDNPPLTFNSAEIDAIVARMRKLLATRFEPGAARNHGVSATD